MSKQQPQAHDFKAIVDGLTPSINKSAQSILKATKTFDGASSKFYADLSRVMNSEILVAVRKSGLPKTEPALKALKAQIRGCQPFVDAVAIGLLERKTVTEYAEGLARAYFHEVDWSASLKNNPEMALPGSKAGKGGDGAGKAGKVESTTRKDLDDTARKFLKQARLLGLTGLAADVLDVLVAGLDGFTETQPEAPM